MSSPAEVMPVDTAPAVVASTKRRWAFTVGFLIAIAVAMLGWLTGLGWVAIWVVKWLLN